MNILVIDAQGGGIGKQVVAAVKKAYPETRITAVGTNVMATSAMLKAGADTGATGENAVIVGCRKADLIIGPVGIVIADSLSGEITPAMAVAVGQSSARRILIPINHCDNYIVGVPDLAIGRLIEAVLKEIDGLTFPGLSGTLKGTAGRKPAGDVEASRGNPGGAGRAKPAEVKVLQI